jgi:hypothetical protein
MSCEKNVFENDVLSITNTSRLQLYLQMLDLMKIYGRKNIWGLYHKTYYGRNLRFP